MDKKKVFIGWSGENIKIAQAVGELLSNAGYTPIVGGGGIDNSIYVGTKIMLQMDSSDFAIILVEKETRENSHTGNTSTGLNANIMFEWGYLLRKLPQNHNVRIFGLNTDDSELPSDLRGCWSKNITKKSWAKAKNKEKIILKIAQEIYDEFARYIEQLPQQINKLDYFDYWEDNKQDIFHYDENKRITEKLLYGLQISTYSNEYTRLYECLTDLLKKDSLNNELRQVIKCAVAGLNVFVKTVRLTRHITKEEYYDLQSELDMAYEKTIQNPDLKAWCEIFRTDKLELCTEIYAYGLSSSPKKKSLLEDALDLCYETLKLIDKQVEKNPDDENYSLLYRSFITRNISKINGELYKLEPNEKYLNEQKKACSETLDIRLELFELYKGQRPENTITKDYITQEYVLALVEQYGFEDDVSAKRSLKRKFLSLFHHWKEKNEIQNSIFNTVKQEASIFFELKDE